MMKTFEVKVQKESLSTHFGLMLAQKAGSSQIMIKDISPKGAFANTDFVPGLQLLKIDGQTIDTVHGAVQALKSAPIGKVTAIAKGFIAKAHKKDQDTKIGISLQKLQRPEGVSGPAELVIASVSEAGIFADSGLQIGYRISSINGKACPPMLSEATVMIKEAPVGDLTLVAVESEMYKPTEKASATKLASLGAYLDKHHVSMGDSTFASVKSVNGDEEQPQQEEPEFTIEPNSEAVVERELNSIPIVQGGVVVEEGGVFDSEYGEPREPEFTIEPNSAAASQRMLNTPFSTVEEGVIDSEYDEIEEPHPSNYHLVDVTTTISKRFPGEKVGLALKNVKESHTVIVNRLVKDGLAVCSRTPLSLGQTILYINGQKCPPSAKRATTLVTEAPRTITIIARNTKVTAFKQTADTKLGITLRSTKRSPRVTVEHVDPDGLFGDSVLSKGQIVAAVNGEDCPDNALAAIQMLRSAVGEVSVVVGYKAQQPAHHEIHHSVPPIVAAIEEPQIVESVQEPEPEIAKGMQEEEPEIVERVLEEEEEPVIVVGVQEEEEEPEVVEEVQEQEPKNLETRSTVSNKEAGKWIGISFGKTEGVITVRKIQDESPLANSEIQVDHAIVAVNDEACPESITDLISKVQRSSGELVITSAPVEEASEVLAALPQPKSIPEQLPKSSPAEQLPKSSPGPTLLPGQVVAKITKSTKEEKIGIKVVRSLQDRIVISSITEGSLLSGTDLAPGQFIVSVNGIPCPPTKDETARLIRDIVGPVEIIASSSIGKVVKPTASTKVGIILGRTVSNEMIIVDIKKGSILEDDSAWALREDQLVVSINGVACPDNIQDAIGMIRSCVGDLTVVAVDRFKQQNLENSENQSSSEAVASIKSPQNGTESTPVRLEAAPEVPEIAPVVSEKSPEDSEIAPVVSEAAPEVSEIAPVVSETAPEVSDPVAIAKSPKNGSTPEFKEIQAVAYDKQASDMLGLSMGVTQDYVFVNHISEDSPFVNTDLCVGHRIAQIDGEDCPLPLSDAMELFAQHVGTMTIDAKEKIVSPGQVSASTVKQSQQTNAGVGFGESDQGRVVVSKIDPKGLFADSSLGIGHVVESVNGRHCLDAQAAYEMLVSASGKVTILASTTVATAVKQNIDESTGILLGQSADGKHIIVEDIEESGIFAKTGLKIGQRVISIAGVSCPRSLTEAEGLIQDRVGELSIVAVDTIKKTSLSPLENGNSHTQEPNLAVTVSVYKQTQQSKVGMKMRKGTQDSKVIVSGVNEDGPAGGKGLEVGMYVISIDGIPCPSDPKTASGIIKEATGHFEIVASPTVASISKKTKHEKLGVTFGRTENDEIVVHSIASNSSFKATDLQVGQKVVSINGQKCSGLLDEAIRTLAGSGVGSVTIVALDILKS
mmetsp:Transcript_17225/g.41973  ORF Transcript_17225/g.41973 Transcript_17225/m.41973 type:complete len:1392 (-) Transcript_17225:1183-5358(-)